jgi:RNA-binding protein NOB1
MGSAKGQKAGGTGLILREDQKEFMNGMRREDIRRQKEERQLERAAKAQAEGKGKGLGAWNDPDVSRAVLLVAIFAKIDIRSRSGFPRSSPSACRARVGTRLGIICHK